MKLRDFMRSLACGASERKCRRVAQFVFLGLLLSSCRVARAQERLPTPTPASDLARQNFERVAASASQIEVVLHKDSGLMVELKRWVAKDATDNGQLVSDSDLTDQAIYDRLERDVRFRSVATDLLQRFGYLLPQVNPESPQAKEQELLIQDRAKWQAQDEEEERTAAREKQQRRGLEQTQGCDPQMSSDCNSQQHTQPIGQPQQFGTPNPAQNPPTGARPVTPQRTLPTLEEAQLMESGGQLPLDNPYSSLEPLSGQPGIGSTAFLPAGTGLSSGTQGAFSQDSAARQLAMQGQSLRDAMRSTEMGANSQAPALSAGQSPDALDRSSGGAESGSESGYGRQPYGPTRGYYEPSGFIPSQTMLRQPDPYVDVPSLYDMYLQAVPQPPAPQRFGEEVFENGTRDLQMIPMDLPVGPDYVVGPGDSLAISLWGSVSQQLLRVVDREGRVNLPEAGPVLVAGKDLADVQQSVQKTLRSQFRNVSVDVSLAKLRTIRVYVVGDVAHPGAYDISSLSTPLNALFAAGGPTSQGSLRIVEHNRGDQTVQSVDVYDLLLNGVRTDIQRLENGDTVLVPPIGSEVTVEGMVRRPAIYELRNEKTLAGVLALAGGLLPTATLRHIEVQRVIAHEKRTMLSLNVAPDADAAAISNQLSSFQIQDGDKVRIFPIAPYNQDTVYLEGHVLRPGRYSYHDGMRVTDLISSYKDLLPEPAAQYAEIIRLKAPDYRPVVESFDLANALSHPGSAPLLDALDTVQIFGRYDFENPPTVSVGGDVRAPGTYRTSGQIRLSDAIHMAGGLAPDAETQDVQVFRHLPNGESSIFSVKLSAALADDPASNIVLAPRDRILVHRNPTDVDPATVYIKGEVARPGRYPVTANMTVANLIHAAGGLQQSADLDEADLTRYQWKGQTKLTGQHQEIALNAALKEDPSADVPLRNGDVLTIRQLPGWNDLGAAIELRGEVTHPGGYGIRPGEKLSAVLTRAGGFTTDAYPYGAVLERSSVRTVEEKSHDELIERIKDMQNDMKLKSAQATDPEEKLAQAAAYQQWQTSLENLASNPPVGRVAIQVSGNLKSWANTSRDIVVQAGDVLVIPKRPSYVMVQGQVYDPTAVAYRPGKSAKWYLSQGGGPTSLANKKAIFVIRADGTVIGSHGSPWFLDDTLAESLQPGDTVVVPEKALGGPPRWNTIFQVAQVVGSVTTSAILAAHY